VLAPQWVKGATGRDAFRRGIIESRSVPLLVVYITFAGFGALARDVGLDIYQAIFITGTVFALPGQVVLADQIGHGVGLAAAAFAVTLTAVRLLPLTFTLMPLLRHEHPRRWLELFLCHIIAITVWIEGQRRLPSLPHHLRLPYFFGFAVTMFICVMLSTLAGYLLAAQVSDAVAAGMVFLTPVYFFLSLAETSVTLADRLAVVIGAISGPFFFLFAPGFDLFLTGLIGGSAAYGLMKYHQSRGHG